MFSDHDGKILSTLIESKKPLTGYAISKVTHLPLSTILYKLERLELIGIVDSHPGAAVKYSPHPVLLKNKELLEIAGHVEIITDIINLIRDTEPEGMKALLLFIINHTKFILVDER